MLCSLLAEKMPFQLLFESVPCRAGGIVFHTAGSQTKKLHCIWQRHASLRSISVETLSRN